MQGIILLNKKPGITSFDTLRDIKRALSTGKVGHTGTLDKFAKGLLVVLAGRALKLSRWFTGCDKQYLGKIKFGEETDTLDPEGSIIAQAPLPDIEDVKKILINFTGDILQTPPIYSAIHIDGKRAHELVRSGIIPEMKKRPVTIYKLELCSWDPPFADIFVHCSSGTYIRSLARDIALAAGSRGHLVSLERTAVAGLTANDKETSAFSAYYSPSPITKSILNAINLPCFDITPENSQKILHGKPLEQILKNTPLETLQNDTAAALFCEETLVAVVEKREEKWKYGCVI
jgi:tRNA pseudouridine55 synthase